MPMYDRACRECAWTRADCYEPIAHDFACPQCGAETCRVWTSSANVIGDEIPGGFVQENFGDQPETFYSKSAMAKRAKELGLRPFVRHMGEQGSDRSKHTTRWI